MKDLKQELEALSVSLNEMKEAMNLSLNLMNSRIEKVLKEANKTSKRAKLLPFDIEKAKQGAKVVTREGGDVRILCYDRISNTDPIVALVLDSTPLDDDEEEEEEIVSFQKNGRYYNDGDESGYDLFIEEECV